MSKEDFDDIVKEIRAYGVFFTNDCGEYWSVDPRSEDGYALDAIQVTIQELTEKELKAHFDKVKNAEEAKAKKKAEDRQKNTEKWNGLFKTVDDLDSHAISYLHQYETLKARLTEYNFPSKIKDDKEAK